MLVSRSPSALSRPLRGFISSDSTFFKCNWSSFTPSQTGITIHNLNHTTFPYIWLRDSCQSPSCIHPATKQKLHRSSDIPLDIQPNSIRLNDRELEIDWVDGRKSVFSRSFLETYSDKKLYAFHKDIDEVVWDNESIRRSELFLSYEEIGTPRGLVKGITQLAKYGLLFVKSVPNEKTNNEECELKRLAERFGEIRPTFYGLLWDVVNLRDSKNIAYTSLELGLHMDLLYFQHPPRYQILHCLRNRVHGGTSIFVDGLAVAETLRKTRPDYFDVLTKTPVAFHYINDGHRLHHEHPTIELVPPTATTTSSSSSQRRVGHINYSPPFQAPLPLDTRMEFYPALKEFSKLLNDPTNTYEYTLREGDAVLFDNRRVLHARTAFYDKEDGGQKLKEGEPNRWLKGCYLEADAIMDRGRVLRMKIESGLL
ncbi:Trimethyllysine dioxygenase, mitochondrial [Leucoagaricus sp. SymC.cos]|nr:Trimethyllysine dioxygenase, mitochondrial [Leucoagaricus sp. SymC.cos]